MAELIDEEPVVDELVSGIAAEGAMLGAAVLGMLAEGERSVVDGVLLIPCAKAPPAASARIEVASRRRFIDVAPDQMPDIRRHQDNVCGGSLFQPERPSKIDHGNSTAPHRGQPRVL